ncbi:MAG: hypothetical protein ACHREM_04110 [Polyangiales bacterium]
MLLKQTRCNLRVRDIAHDHPVLTDDVNDPAFSLASRGRDRGRDAQLFDL